MITKFATRCVYIIALLSCILSGAAAAPTTRGRASATSVAYGQAITFYTDGSDPAGQLITVVGYVRGPNSSTYSPPDWSGWSQILNSNFSARTSHTGSVSFTPTAVGNWQYHANAGTNAGWAGTSITSWASWNTFTAGPAVVGNFSVARATPIFSNWAARTFTGPYTVSGSDLNASVANPYSSNVTPPGGSLGYSINGSSVSAGTVLQPGTYTVRASYPGDTRYNSAISDVTWTVNAVPVPAARGRASSTTVAFGQSITLYADGQTGSNALVALTGWVRGPSATNYVPPSWTGWTQIINSTFPAVSSKTASATYTPTGAGIWQFHANAINTSGVYASNNVSQWVSWNVYSTGPAVAASFTVAKATPIFSNWAGRTFTGPYTVTAADLNASVGNPYSSSVTPPSGSLGYSINGTSVSAGTVLQPGTYTVRASYAGDTRYNSAVSDVTWTVNAVPVPSARGRASSTMVEFGESITLHADGQTGSTNALVALTGWVRGPSATNYVPPSWTGWTQVINATFPAVSSNTASATYTPTGAGIWQFHANAINTSGVHASNDVSQWVSWNVYSTGPVVAASFTVAKAAPLVSNWATRAVAAPYTVTAADLSAAFRNPHTTGVTAPSGGVTYSVVETGATVQPGTVLNAIGRHTIRATYSGDGNYTAATADAVWNVRGSFKILVNVNQLKGDEAAQITGNPNGDLATADGVWTVNLNHTMTPSVGTQGYPDWPAILATLTNSGQKWIVSEDLYMHLPVPANRPEAEQPAITITRGILGRVDQAMVYHESFLTDANGQSFALQVATSPGNYWSPTDSVLLTSFDHTGAGIYRPYPYSDVSPTVQLPDQIGIAANAVSSGQILVDSRTFNTQDTRNYYTKNALNHPSSGGVVFEFNPIKPSALPGNVLGPTQMNIFEGSDYAFARGKKVYLLLAPTFGSYLSNDYLGDIQSLKENFASRQDLLANSNLYLVLSIYVRQTTNVGFFTGDSGTGSTTSYGNSNSLVAAFRWLKDYRAGLLPVQ